jgi:ubiquinone/menaquinone biosynthesis C-methylase UbiE
MDEAATLAEQISYYRARAHEYDGWWLREGRYDRGPEANARWFAEVETVERAVAEFEPAGEVLELACGTGLWTRRLIDYAAHVTAVDSSDEVIAINRVRVDDQRVEYVQADLFEWTPPVARFDVCFFGFWLSHVPEARFEQFWEKVRGALRPGGRVLFIDSDRSDRSTAADHHLPELGEETMTRRLDDGRQFQIIKRFYEPAVLEERLAELGWTVEVQCSGEFFICGAGAPA